jgi:hypothetical protein
VPRAEGDIVFSEKELIDRIATQRDLAGLAQLSARFVPRLELSFAFLEALKARHEALKAGLAAAERVADARLAATIAAELQEMADKASAELLRFADRLAAFTNARPRPWWCRLVG